MVRVDSTGSSPYAFQVRLATLTQVAAPPTSFVQRSLALHSLEGQLRHLRLALERLGDKGSVSGSRRASAAKPAQAMSASPLALDPVATFTTLASVEEINTTPTSVAPLGPEWGGFGSSSAQATLGGVYSGIHGTGTLDFRVAKAGVHGSKDLEIDVYDPSDTFIETIQIKKKDPIQQLYTLSNGLTLTLGAGDLIDLDAFQVDVDASLPPSFSPTTPVWNGVVSSAEATIGGVYDGSDGTGTFRFEVRRDGVHGEDDLEVRVLRPGGGQLQVLDIDKNDPLDQVYTLDNGLTFTLGAGELLDDDVFTVQAFDTVGSVVDPSKPFDGVRNDDPNFEPSFVVSAGSFEVNGVAISVAANDSIDSVLAKITASSAGVSAAFHAGSETIVLTQTTPGSAPTITLANDTSGFLDATKLSSAFPTPGQDGGDPVGEPIAAVPALASVVDGTFSVNGVGITVDVDVDSLADVIDRVNQSAAGATASFDPATLRLTIVSNDPSASLLLDDPTTGFLSAVKITARTYAPTAARRAAGGPARNVLPKHLAELVRHLAPLLRDGLTGLGRGEVAELRGDLRSAVEESFRGFFGEPSIPVLRSGFGLDFHFSRADTPSVEFDRAKLDRALRRAPVALGTFLFQDDAESATGLVPSLLSAVQSLQIRVAANLGTLLRQGAVVDLRA